MTTILDAMATLGGLIALGGFLALVFCVAYAWFMWKAFHIIPWWRERDDE